MSTSDTKKIIYSMDRVGRISPPQQQISPA